MENTEKNQEQIQEWNPTSRVLLNGSYRRINLFRGEPNPADSFIPKEDKLAILFQISVTKRELEQEKPLQLFRKNLAPSIKVKPEMCTIEYCISTHGKKHFFEVVYHVYDLPYGEELYKRLMFRYFD